MARWRIGNDSANFLVLSLPNMRRSYESSSIRSDRPLTSPGSTRLNIYPARSKRNLSRRTIGRTFLPARSSGMSAVYSE